MPNIKCLTCGKEIYISPSRKTKFCSFKCKGESMKGKPFFDSTGIPSWNKGTKGLMNTWNKGKKGVYTQETLEKMRENGLRYKGENHPQWKGGARRKYGYVMIFSPEHPFKDKNNCVPEHRLVMEKHIGRYLLKEEVVHHINSIRDDNRIDNLMLFSSHREHMCFHRDNGGIKGRPKKQLSQ